MKRRFSFNLAPVRVPTRAETKALKESLASRDISTPDPPVRRRILSPKTEAELRAACEAILHQDDNSYGAAAAIQAAEPNTDFQALHRSMKALEADRSHRRAGSHRPEHPIPRREREREHAEPTVALPAHAFACKPDAALRHLFPAGDSASYAISMQANTGRPREAQGTVHDSKSFAKHRERSSGQSTVRPGAIDRPSTAPIGRDVDSPDTNHSTPLSASTDNHRQYASTAMTSAEPPSRTSKRSSRHLFGEEDAVSRADAAATHWMRQEYEHLGEDEDGQRLATTRTSRAASMTRSIKSEIKEYFRPSSGLSRATSRESLRSANSETHGAPAAPTHGWRSWTLQRRPTEASLNSPNSRSGSVRESADSRTRERKEINLNRELPPLPGLDQWQDPEQQDELDARHFEKPKSPTHIADLMQGQPTRVRSRKNHIAQQESTERLQRRADGGSLRKMSAQNARPGMRTVMSDSDVPMHFQPRADDAVTRDLATSHLDFDNLMSAMRYGSSTEGINRSSPSLADSGHSPDELYRGLKPSMRISIDKYRGETLNFSKKISVERHRYPPALEPRYKHKAQIKPNNTLADGSADNVKGLKKVFSSLVLGGKKEKKPETWMDRFEKDGIKGGILVHDEAAGAPVVRY